MRTEEKISSFEVRTMVFDAISAALGRESVFLNSSLVFAGAELRGELTLTLYGREDQDVGVVIRPTSLGAIEVETDVDVLSLPLAAEKRKPGRPKRIGGLDDYGSGPTVAR